ncbi:Ferredoxin subunit of nitrite reductase or a ring-hydroxylating dioxygenase [Spirosomataceae bacterium TFI 002]|nr:Ferredoxin subunit of nitrite reductase or a ring-hydroxylating dioxygenase [Spirosomataceae bacterium TFI 002]
MNRLEFLKSIGFKGASLMAVLQACTQDEDSIVKAKILDSNNNEIQTDASTTSQKNYLLKIDLNNSSYSKLSQSGGYIRESNIVVANTGNNTFAAATQVCTHEPKKDVIFNSKEWYCTAHGARFSLAGNGLNTRGSGGLSIYKVIVENNILFVTKS